MSLFSSFKAGLSLPSPASTPSSRLSSKINSARSSASLHRYSHNHAFIHKLLWFITHICVCSYYSIIIQSSVSLNQTNRHDMRKVLIVVLCAPHTHQTLKSINQQESQKPICHVPCSEDSGSRFGPLRHVPARISAAQRWQQQQKQQVQKPLDRTRRQSLWSYYVHLYQYHRSSSYNSVFNLFSLETALVV